MNEDVGLMARVAAGDRTACDVVARRLIGHVQAVALSLLRNLADARDASQASLLEILRSARSFRGECSLERWASRITVRTSLRWVRRERRLRGDGEAPAAEQTSASEGPAKVLSDECLATLPAVQQTTLILRCALEYSIEEIAQLTAVSPNTVKDRLLRARATLRVWLEAQQSGRTSHEVGA